MRAAGSRPQTLDVCALRRVLSGVCELSRMLLRVDELHACRCKLQDGRKNDTLMWRFAHSSSFQLSTAFAISCALSEALMHNAACRVILMSIGLCASWRSIITGCNGGFGPSHAPFQA